jgi:hypothetical protein
MVSFIAFTCKGKRGTINLVTASSFLLNEIVLHPALAGKYLLQPFQQQTLEKI